MTHHQFYDGLNKLSRRDAYRHRGARWANVDVRCAGRWATAFVFIGNARGANEVTAVEKHSSRRGWHQVDRDRPCAAHRIPKSIYRDACESN